MWNFGTIYSCSEYCNHNKSLNWKKTTFTHIYIETRETFRHAISSVKGYTNFTFIHQTQPSEWARKRSKRKSQVNPIQSKSQIQPQYAAQRHNCACPTLYHYYYPVCVFVRQARVFDLNGVYVGPAVISVKFTTRLP